MTIGKAIRWLLAWAATLVVLWSFFEVSLRLWRKHVAAERHTQLTILHWGDASEERNLSRLIAEYESEHPEIKITRIQATDFDAKLKTMLAAGAPPDLFYLSTDHVSDFASLHLVADLEPYIAAMPDGQKW